MIKEELLISDTNIFFDLISTNLLDSFFMLPYEFSTTDLVLNEIKQPGQMEAIQPFIESQQLQVFPFDVEELSNMTFMYENIQNKVSIEDCSVWYLAKKNGGRLLTGDNRLRKLASDDGVEVSGTLFVFDHLLEQEILAPKIAADILESMFNSSRRLPEDECRERIERWRMP